MRLKCRRKYKIYIAIILIFIVSLFSGYMIKRLEGPFVSAYTSYANRICNEAVNDAIAECFHDKSLSYDDLISLKTDSSGRIISLSTNTFKINNLKADISKSVDKNIELYNGKSVKINLGAAQDNLMAASFGPTVKVRIKPYSTTKTMFRDEFVSAGINQVRHCIYLDISSTVTLSGFSIKKTYKTDNSVLIADTVIVGSVPEFYGSSFANLKKTEG